MKVEIIAGFMIMSRLLAVAVTVAVAVAVAKIYILPEF